MKNNILLVYGGNSVEHEISIITALQIKNQYKGKYNLILCYLKDGHFYISNKLESLDFYKNDLSKRKKIQFIANKNYIKVKSKKIFFDAVWIVAHGSNCEDGTLYSYFKTLNINVIAEPLLPAMIGQNKVLSKKLCNVDTLPFYEINKYSFDHHLKDIIVNAKNISFPLMLKPCNLGSSIGICEIQTIDELIDKIEQLFNLTNELIIEKKLNNFIELNVAAFFDGKEIILSDVEKVSNNKVLSYEDKYVNNKKSMLGQKREIPAIINNKIQLQLEENAKTIYYNLKAKYIVRMDFLYDLNNEKLYFNEINNIPGSLSIYLFKNKGYSCDNLVDIILDTGLKNVDEEKHLVTTYKNNIFKEGNINNVKLKK